MTTPYIKLDKPLHDYAVLCRGCLAESGEMKNIFEWGLADDFFKIVDLEPKRSENLSELLCTTCESSLLTCRSFREQVQRSDVILKHSLLQNEIIMTSESDPNNGVQNTTLSNLLDNTLTIVIVAPDMTAKIYLMCPYCQQKYTKQSDLRLHLIRNHKVNEKELKIKLQYYCHVPSCSYYLNSGKNKHFTERKFLNQHFIKVHLAKEFACDGCDLKFATNVELNRHSKICNTIYLCHECNKTFSSNELLLVHLMRKHPALHKLYKEERKSNKRASEQLKGVKKQKTEVSISEFICDSPKRSFATQTKVEDNIKNDVALPSWHMEKNANLLTKTDEISTQTVFEDLLSLKSQGSEDDSMFFTETVSLSDIQTQTFPVEFDLSRSNKETITSETQSPDLSIKETQTCYCLYESPKLNFRLFDSITSSPSSTLTSTETQTLELRSTVKSDVLLSFSSAETQTSFEDGVKDM